jgi:hypothetical protein
MDAMRPKFHALLAGLASVFSVCALSACERQPPPAPPPAVGEPGRISFAAIRDAALAAAPGDVLEVELEEKDGVSLYEFKILSANGRVIEVELDAATGAIVKLEQE